MANNTISVLDHGYVRLRNIAGPTRRPDQPFDADSIDPANSARFSFDGADQERSREQDLKLCRYLIKHRHTTPIEMIEVWLEMQMPIFVARQFVRHRTVSINEISARYVQLPDLFYIPDPKTIGTKSKSNKQGRTISDDEHALHINMAWLNNLEECYIQAYDTYKAAIDVGIPNEIARLALPVGIYTKWLWKQDLHNMMHFLRLRMDSHAQFESREYANAIYKLLHSAIPEAMEIFKELYLEQA